MDDFNRECLAAEVDTSLAGERVTLILERLRERGELPQGLATLNLHYDEYGKRAEAAAFAAPPTLNAQRREFSGL